MPDWYPLIRAARYLGVPPWELLRQQPKWYFQALQAEKAELAGGQSATSTPRTEDAEEEEE